LGPVRLAAVCAFGLALLLAAPSPAAAAWREPVGGLRPISDIGHAPSLASIGGVPYVAWEEVHGPSSQVFVARLNAAGTQWEKVGGPVNADLHADLNGRPSLASVDGVPYVAWVDQGTGSTCASSDIRVARLNAAGNGWTQPWRGEDATHGGLKQDASSCAYGPSLASVDGVPYVAWYEEAFGGGSSVVRVARLDTSTIPSATWSEPWTGVDATHGGLPQLSNDGIEPTLASIDGVPYVAWSNYVSHSTQQSDSNQQIQVARLNAGNSTWEQPWAGVSATYGGINQSPTGWAYGPVLASIRSFAYVGWGEAATGALGANTQARVARLDTSTFGGPTWKQEAAGVSATDGRINESPANSAGVAGLAAVKAGPFGTEVPYVAWDEGGGSPANPEQIRVARFNGTTHGWEQPWAGVTQAYGGINLDPTKDASGGSLATIDGVPWIARDDSGIRVSRLEPEFSSQSVTASATGASFSVVARTFGIGYPIGFEYGNLLQHDSGVENTALGTDSVTVTRQVGGLTPATTYQYRPFALAGVTFPRALGTALSFATGAAARNPSGRATMSSLSETNSLFTVGRASTALSGRTAASRHKQGTVFSFRLDLPATVKIAIQTNVQGRRVGRTCKPDSRKLRHNPRCTRTVTGATLTRSARPGLNRVPFTARIHGKALKPARYEALFTPTNAAGASARGTLGFALVKR
jgi:hypothetical protein